MSSRFMNSKSERRAGASRSRSRTHSRTGAEPRFAKTKLLAPAQDASPPKLRPVRPHRALLVAGGSEGQVFAGLVLARAMHAHGWQVHWLGTANSVEECMVAPGGFAFESIHPSGVGGKGMLALMVLPLRLLRACWQARAVIHRIKPHVVIGLGGDATLAAGMAARLAKKPLVLHEKNAVPGLPSKVLARMVKRTYTAFPSVLPNGRWVGNPLRSAFSQQVRPERRLAKREGPLRLLVVGGRLGSDIFDQIVPKALEWMHADQRPLVTHQSDEQQIAALRRKYQAAKVEPILVPFIDDMASALAEADLVLCHAGASIVAEIAAVGVATVFVPRSNASDDHQTANAHYLVKTGGAWLIPQSELTVKTLAKLLESIKRPELVKKAQKARTMKKSHAVQEIVMACEKLVR